MREFGLWQFIKIAESQQKAMKEALDFGSREKTQSVILIML